MRYILTGVLAAFLFFLPALPALAWDGFDADSADLVEIVPDTVPAAGDTITVRNRDRNTEFTCIVIAVKRNSRTTEVSVRCQDDPARTLVMEGI